MGSPFATAIKSHDATFIGASPAAVEYLRALMTEKAQVKGRDMGAAIESINRWLAGHSDKATVSANIDRLKAEGFTDRSRTFGTAELPEAAVVPAGRYALDTQDGATNTLAFYKVDRPTGGRWASRVFVKLMVSDEEQRLSWAVTKDVLNRITEVGAAEASARYGHEIGECGICGRTLTNDVSRARGIGPVCAEKMGW